MRDGVIIDHEAALPASMAFPAMAGTSNRARAARAAKRPVTISEKPRSTAPAYCQGAPPENATARWSISTRSLAGIALVGLGGGLGLHGARRWRAAQTQPRD